MFGVYWKMCEFVVWFILAVKADVLIENVFAHGFVRDILMISDIVQWRTQNRTLLLGMTC